MFIGTFVTSIPARLLFIDGLDASWTDIRFNGAETSINTLKLAAVLEFGLIVTQIGTAVVLFPIVVSSVDGGFESLDGGDDPAHSGLPSRSLAFLFGRSTEY